MVIGKLFQIRGAVEPISQNTFIVAHAAIELQGLSLVPAICYFTVSYLIYCCI